ncbi:MAG: tetratricopeptide repeat protein [Gemmatimonadetes bacterium]|nr:tetratricopeptide repeat protein [Gemmatimonadota bacterium]
MPKLVRTLFERRIPHILALYVGASWGIIEFVNFAVDEFLLSPHWTRVALVAVLLLLPTVFMLAWFHGKPGKDADEMPRAEKIGIPVNLVLCAGVLWLLFGGEDLGAATTSVTVETEDGELVEREVAKAEFRKRTILFPLDLGDGLGEDESWLAYAVPGAIEYDLSPDEFFEPIPAFVLRDRLEGLGFPDLLGVPTALKRELSDEVFAEFFGAGEIERVDGRYRITLRLHEVGDGSVAGEIVQEGTDLLTLVDEMSVPIKNVLGIPEREGIEDLPVRDWLSEDFEAVAEYYRGTAAMFVDQDLDGGIRLLTSATTRDPTFTAAQFTRYLLLLNASRLEEAMIPLQTSMANLYRLPERHRFIVKAEYYFLAQDVAKAAAVVEMWVELHPNDAQALRYRLIVQQGRGDSEGMLATLTALRGLDPRDGSVLLQIAGVQEELGDNNAALGALAEYVDAFPEDETGYVRLASLERRLGRHADARESLERAILINPLSSRVTAALAVLDLYAGNFAEARAGYERALELARTSAERAQVLDGLKGYHVFRGEVGEAIRAANAWVEEASSYMSPIVLAQERIGDLYIYNAAGREVAAGFLDEMKAQIPAPLDDYLMPYLESSAFAEWGDLEAAREAHGRAVEMAEAMQFGQILEDLQRIRARIDELAGDYESAIDGYRAALGADPGVRLRRALGRTLYKAGRMDEAEAELREALVPVPANPSTRFELALVLEAKGDMEGAVEHLRTALAAWESADEDYGPAASARAKLEELGG